jgi:hypothetical protein
MERMGKVDPCAIAEFEKIRKEIFIIRIVELRYFIAEKNNV